MGHLLYMITEQIANSCLQNKWRKNQSQDLQVLERFCTKKEKKSDYGRQSPMYPHATSNDLLTTGPNTAATL